jgi:diaminohydroxyphosphoribosylaminopyrimidine deaminase/5-amino-6-(5-phosphoribosylamino)uracil reductase
VLVDEGCCGPEARALIAPFASWVSRGRPYVTLKLGVSLDGRIADAAGRSRWITGPAARAAVQAMRRRCDAILVGAETARRDDPGLQPRPAGGRKPWRIVVDSRGRLALSLRLFRGPEAARTIVATTAQCPAARRAAYASAGASVWVLPAAGGGVSLRSLVRRAARHGVLHILCEGGGGLAESLIRAGLPDEYVFFLAPLVIGGSGARAAVGGTGWSLARAPRLRFVETRPVGADLMVRAVPAGM